VVRFLLGGEQIAEQALRVPGDHRIEAIYPEGPRFPTDRVLLNALAYKCLSGNPLEVRDGYQGLRVAADNERSDFSDWTAFCLSALRKKTYSGHRKPMCYDIDSVNLKMADPGRRRWVAP
jgi:hypothetical protein